VWVGATLEDAGFVKAVTPDGLAALARHLESVAPALRAAPVLRSWSGLRPCVPDGGPVLGPAPGLANVLVALGHHRAGILLAPVTARTIAAYAGGIAPPVEAAPFRPES
jgi:glycine oxidase